jgi:Terminase large subunit, T4likevirus-type, N-terminal
MGELEEAPTRDDLKAWMWNRGDLEWKLWPQQAGIYQTIKSLPPAIQTVVVLAARQFGKSYLATLMAVEDCLRHPGYTIVIVGPTIKQTVDIVHQAMRQISLDAPPNLISRSKSETRWYIGESELVVGGFDTNTATRQRGKRALKVYVEEVVDSNPDQYIEALRSDLGPMLTHSPEPRMVYVTTPPRIPDHPFLTQTVPEAQLYGAFFKFTIKDNHQLTPAQYDACVRRSGGESTIEFRREYMCEIVRDTSLVVVPEFDISKHVTKLDWPIDCKPQVTIDWGGVRDMTVALLHTYDYLQDCDLVLGERVFPPNTQTEHIIAELRNFEGRLQIEGRYADVPGQLQVDLNGKGYEIRLPVKQDWQAGINYMNARFAMGKVRIDEKCRMLIQTCQSGVFNRTKTDFDRTLALGHCDALAALMYALRSQDRQAPWARGRGDIYDAIIPNRQRQTDEAKVAQAINPAFDAATFGVGIYKPKKFGAFR